MAALLRTIAGAEPGRAHLTFGISARLIMAFVAVAILAAGANLIAIDGASIIRTTRYGASARAAPAPVHAPAVPAVSIEPVVAPVASRASVDATALLAAVETFSRAVRERVLAESSDTRASVDVARSALERASADYLTMLREYSAVAPAGLGRHLKGYEQAAAQAVDNADRRRAALEQFSAHLESMDSRVKASEDKAWRILGRVVTRQALVQLNSALDELRRRAVVLKSPDSHDEASLQRLRESEDAVASLLAGSEKAFVRNDGDQWLAQMRVDAEQLLGQQAVLLALDTERQVGEQQLSRLRASLQTLLSRSLAVSVRPTVDISGPAQIPAANISPPAGVTMPAAAGVTEFVVESRAGGDSHRFLIAWLSGAVLLLLILISVHTVRSIVLPVRRLLRATAQLASDDVPTPIARGGIRELDTLAVAFNRMAEQVVAARASSRLHQNELEFKVEVRTRELHDLASHDPLTGLPNRRRLFLMLNDALAAARGDGTHVGVFFVDVDNFKNINDGMGHAFGDAVLVSIAERLRICVRDSGFAARLGGDEFTIVHAAATSMEQVREVGIAIVGAFAEPLRVRERELHVSISVGASVFPDHEQDAEALLRAADAALFRAKALGRSRLSVFTPDLLQIAADKFTTEQGLRRALDHGEFELVFQPELSADTFETRLVEALVRWRTPDGRLILPGEFLAVAEESGLIIEISDWVLRSAVQWAAHWHHGEWPAARVAINVSPRQILDDHFVARLLALLQEFNLPARCIEIELTETILQTGTETITTLRRLAEHGIAIALDDFGTGYSTLSSLELLPLTRIKLDRSLIASIDSSPRSAAIARAIIGLCSNLELEITAEGVERPEQFSLLLGHPGMFLQGYLLARPVSGAELAGAMQTASRRAEELLLTSTAGAAASASAPALPVAISG